jgi:hypothetical protein
LQSIRVKLSNFLAWQENGGKRSPVLRLVAKIRDTPLPASANKIFPYLPPVAGDKGGALRKLNLSLASGIEGGSDNFCNKSFVDAPRGSIRWLNHE